MLAVTLLFLGHIGKALDDMKRISDWTREREHRYGNLLVECVDL